MLDVVGDDGLEGNPEDEDLDEDECASSIPALSHRVMDVAL